MPEISVIIPCHNIESYIGECLGGLLSQTFQDFEILVMENASEDSTLSTAKRYAEEDKRVRVFSLDTKGVSNARNEGLKHAYGKYVAFVDGDDFFSEDYLFELHKNISADPRIDLAIVPYVLYYPDKTLKECDFDYSPRVLLKDLGGGIVDGRPFAGCSSLCGTLMRRKTVESGGLRFDGYFFEDTLFIRELQLICRGVSVSDKGRYYYRMKRPGQITGQHSVKMVKDILDMHRKHQKIYLKYPNTGKYMCMADKMFAEYVFGDHFGSSFLAKMSKKEGKEILNYCREDLMKIRLSPEVCPLWQIKWFGYFRFWFERGWGYEFLKFMRICRNIFFQPFGICKKGFPSYIYKK